MTRTMFAVALSLVIALGMAAGTAQAQKTKTKTASTTIEVDCNSPSGQTIQDAVDEAQPGKPLTIFIEGTCTEDVSITKDDITLSGNQVGDPCNKTPGGTGTIEGTVTVDGVRAKIEFLTVTGPGEGVRIENRADARLTCNDISNNAESGVIVARSSNTVLVDNTLSGNGRRSFEDPNIFFDCGLYVLDASSVRSDGNTYEDNQYCAISSSRHAAFRNGTFLPREPGHPADPDERDVYTAKGCFPGSGVGCFTNDFAPIAIELFNNGLVDLRNFEINGAVRAAVGSSFRLDADGTMRGNMFNEIGSFARIRNREAAFDGERQVTFTGILTCDGSSQTYFSSVQCGQTCDGIIAGDTLPNTCTPP